MALERHRSPDKDGRYAVGVVLSDQVVEFLNRRRELFKHRSVPAEALIEEIPEVVPELDRCRLIL
jgi:hypothetical protein